ncbi:MAG: hypothetical protein IJ644_03730 [Oscillospiraceae bacterium]|nr:hypothetical protein [Oscillospiraceae bacterium]
MESFKDSRGNWYNVRTESKLATGGEGDIYDIDGRGWQVAKIIHANTPVAKVRRLSDKITKMENYYNSLGADAKKIISRQITWPEIALFDANNNFRGYIMQKVTGHETLDCAYSHSQNVKSNFSLKDKVLIARNLCVAVNVLHHFHHVVVGDFNPRNILVSISKATVYLVDADSFHFQFTRNVNGRTITELYPALVGRSEYLPKELVDYMKSQNAQLDNCPQPTFNRESDLFALAIHIFCLLMNGTHPFAVANPAAKVQSVSSVDLSLHTNIAKGRYVYSKNPLKRAGYIPPEYAPPYSILPDYLQEMFERAFVLKQPVRQKGDNQYFSDPPLRPSAAEWYYALDNFYKSLKSCGRDSKHWYGSHLSECPWCKMKK